jgi:hypothetical protein
MGSMIKRFQGQRTQPVRNNDIAGDANKAAQKRTKSLSSKVTDSAATRGSVSQPANTPLRRTLGGGA